MSVVSAGGRGVSPVGNQSSSLADVVDTILDKGLVIDAHVSAALVGIELVTIDARVVIASVDTYLRFAQAVNRLDLREVEGRGLPEVVGGVKGAAAESAGRRAIAGAGDQLLEKAGEVIGEIVHPREREREPRRRREDG